jgi:hypothetical protein
MGTATPADRSKDKGNDQGYHGIFEGSHSLNSVDYPRE